jgi:glycosyltransferase involved in cell wall biosynthesis
MRSELSEPKREEALAALATRGFKPENTITAVFAGNFGRTSDLRTLLDAARVLDATVESNVRIVLCGSGEQWQAIRDGASDIKSVLILDRLNNTELQTLFSCSQIGIAPFNDIENYQKNIPNKINEYLAMQLAIVSPVSGCIQALIEDNQLGATYAPGDAAGLARVLSELAANKRQLETARANAERVFHESADASGIYGAYVDALETVAATN